MAWISVHTGVDGPKLRDLRKKLKCSKFEATGILVYLWFWGLENAEKDGRILYADKEDIEECLRGAGAGCKISASVIVESLIETGWIDEVEDGGYYIHDWEEWQEQWYKAKERRENYAFRKREKRKAQAATGTERQETHHEEQSESSSRKEQPPQDNRSIPSEEPKVSKYSTEFEAFWEEYPRKNDKGMAYKKYLARLKDGYSADELITAAKAYRAQCVREKTEQKYIKHPKTFLGDSTPFLDFLQKKKKTETSATPTEANPFEKWGVKSNGLVHHYTKHSTQRDREPSREGVRLLRRERSFGMWRMQRTETRDRTLESRRQDGDAQTGT